MADSWLDTDLQEQRRQAAEQQQSDLASKSVLNPWVGSALQGLTYGFGDEATATVRSIFGTPYNQALEEERANQKQFAQAHPYANVGMQIAGAVPHILLSRGKTAAPTIRRAFTDAAVRGGVEGAIQGFGEGEGGVVSRAKDAALSGGTGALLSGPMEMLTRGLTFGGMKLYDRFAPAFSPSAAETAASRKVAQNVEREGGMDAVRQRVDEYGNQVQEGTDAGLPDPKLTLGEVAGGQSKSALDAALSTPGRGAADLGTQLRLRQQGRLDRVRTALTETFGDLDDSWTAKIKLYESRKADADPLYDAAWAASRPPQAIDLQLMRQLPKGAVHDAEEIARLEGRKLSFVPKFRDDGSLDIEASGIPTVEDMHRLKVGLDTYIEKNTVDGRGNTLANRAGKLRETLRDRIDELTTDETGVSLYKTARDHWAGDSARIDAINLGRRADTMDHHELRAKLARMTEAERAFFVTGYMSDLKGKLSNVHLSGNANPVRLVFDTDSQKDTARIALSTMGLSEKEINARMTRLDNYFGHETTGHLDEGAMTRGSVTAGRTAWQRDLAVPAIGTGGLAYAFTGSPTQAIALGATAALGAGAKAVNQMRTERMNDAMLKILGNSDPAQQRILLDAMERNAQARISTPRGAFDRAGSTVAGQVGADIFSPDDPRLQ